MFSNTSKTLLFICIVLLLIIYLYRFNNQKQNIMTPIYTNPRTNKLQKPKQIYVENAEYSLVIYESFGTDWLVIKKTGEHRAVRSTRFDIVFDKISQCQLCE